MNIEKERAEFEAWVITATGTHFPDEITRRTKSGRYLLPSTGESWAAWQARAALVVERPVPGHVLPPLPEPWIMDMNSGVQEQARRHYAEDQMIDYARAAIAKAEAKQVEQDPVAYMTTDKRTLIFADALEKNGHSPDGMTALFDHPQPETKQEPALIQAFEVSGNDMESDAWVDIGVISAQTYIDEGWKVRKLYTHPQPSADDANVTELLSALDAAQEGCTVPSWAGFENGDGIEVGKRIDAAIAAMKGAK